MRTASEPVLEAPAGFGPDVEAGIVLSKDTFFDVVHRLPGT